MSKIRTWAVSPKIDDIESVEAHAPHNIKSATAKDMCLDAGRDNDMVLIIPCSSAEVCTEPRAGSLQEHCSRCDDLIWVSEKARLIRDNSDKRVVVMCLWCSALINGDFVDYEDGNYKIIQGYEGLYEK